MPSLSSPLVFRPRDLEDCERWKSGLLSLWRDVADEEAFSSRASEGERPPEDRSVGDFWPFAAAAAACWARSLREALPRFFLSRIYSQPRPNSISSR